MSSEPLPAPDANSMMKKEVKVLKTLVEKAEGTVKWYNLRNLYGFIRRSDDNQDIFVHKTAIANFNKFPSLRIGEQVEFKIVETTNGIEAAEVTGPEGSKVKGFRFMNGIRQRGGANQDKNGEGRNGDQDASQNTKPKSTNGNNPKGESKKSENSTDESGDSKKKGSNPRGGRGRRPNNGQMNGAPRFNGASNGDETNGQPRGPRPGRGGRGGAGGARGAMRGGRGRGGAPMPAEQQA